MDYFYLAEDDAGVSYFEDCNFQMTEGDFAPPAPSMLLSDRVAASKALFLVLRAGWGGAKHPSPREQIGLCLSGRVRVEAGNGDVREFGAGAIWWMSDTTGSGHSTTVLGGKDVRMAIIQLG